MPAKDPGKNFWMQRFDSAIHHLGEAGVGGDIDDRQASFFKMATRASGAVNFDAFCGEGFREIGNAGLVTLTLIRARLIWGDGIFLKGGI